MSGETMSTERPNVLLIMTDQHRADHVGFGGNTVVQTPHLDSIAAAGVRFDRAYVANPVCMPNRSSILTGRMPSVHGTVSNGVPLDWRSNTFVRRLAQEGWRTGLIGKSHIQTMGHRTADHVLVPDDGLEAHEFAYPAGWNEWELIDRYNDGPAPEPEDFYGFGHVEFAADHGDLVGGHYRQWLRDQGADWRDYQDLSRHGMHNLTADPTYRPTLSEELYPSTFVTERSVSFIRKHGTEQHGNERKRGEPWMLQCSYPDPHHPFTPPGRFFDRYDPADMELPPTFDDPHTWSVPFIKRKFETKGTPAGFYAWAPNEDQLRRAMAAQFGAIDLIDEGVGRILATLEATGQLHNTIVIFTSDHGELMGDHGLILKMFVHYQGILNVPLVISGPGITPGVVGGLVSSLDLAQTVLDLAGVEPFHGMQGRSLAPMLEDPTVKLRDHVLIEDDFKFGRDPFQIGRRNQMRTVVTENQRYTRYVGTDWTEWFDLGADPHELENRAGEDPVQELELARLMAESMAMHDEPGRRPTHIA